MNNFRTMNIDTSHLKVKSTHMWKNSCQKRAQKIQNVCTMCGSPEKMMKMWVGWGMG
jgi:rRNA maturation endonuclease Nob1